MGRSIHCAVKTPIGQQCFEATCEDGNNNNNNNNNNNKPVGQQCCIQKAWDGPVSANQVTRMLSSTSNDMDKARLLAASSPHTGDWLHAPPIASVGLRLSDEAVRVAVAHRLGCKACVPHTCVSVCVVKQSVHEVSMAWHVAEAVRDISGTVNAMTSYGGPSKEHK